MLHLYDIRSPNIQDLSNLGWYFKATRVQSDGVAGLPIYNFLLLFHDICPNSIPFWDIYRFELRMSEFELNI